MCLIIHKPAGAKVPEDILKEALFVNSDGWGIAEKTETGMDIHKGFWNRSFFEAYDKRDENEMFIHFRLATHGETNVDNCHPFPICDGKYLVIHNGIISIKIEDKTKSDTWHFANKVVAPYLNFDPSLFQTKDLSDLLSDWTMGQKIVIVRTEDGAAHFINKHYGTERGGIWYSNTLSFPWNKTTYYGFGAHGAYAPGRSYTGWESDEWETYKKPTSKNLPAPSIETTDSPVESDELFILAEMTHEDLADLCWKRPDYVAKCIRSFFDGDYDRDDAIDAKEAAEAEDEREQEAALLNAAASEALRQYHDFAGVNELDNDGVDQCAIPDDRDILDGNVTMGQLFVNHVDPKQPYPEPTYTDPMNAWEEVTEGSDLDEWGDAKDMRY